MKEYHFTLSQLIGIFILLSFAFVGWGFASYFYGHLKGTDDAHKQIIEDYKQGIKIERVR